MRFNKRATLLGLAMTVLLVSACSTSPSHESLGPSDGLPNGPRLFENPEQAAAWANTQGYDLMAKQLADGVITTEEYEVAYAAQVSCREEAGWTFESSAAVWNPVDHLKLIRRGEAPSTPDMAKEKACNEQFDYVDFLFQTTATPRMDPQLLAGVKACLDEAGISHSPDATNLPELVGRDAGVSADADAIATCVRGEAAHLYQDLPGLSIAF